MQEQVVGEAEDRVEGAERRGADQPEIRGTQRVAELVAREQRRIHSRARCLGPVGLQTEAFRPLLDCEQDDRQQQQRDQADDRERVAPAVLGDERGVELRNERVAEARTREHQPEREAALRDEPARDDGDADDETGSGERRAGEHAHQVHVGERVDEAVAVEPARQQQHARDHDRAHAVAVGEPAAHRRERTGDEQLEGVAELERAALHAELGEQLRVEDVEAGERQGVGDPDDEEGGKDDSPPAIELPARAIHGAGVYTAATHPANPSAPGFINPRGFGHVDLDDAIEPRGVERDAAGTQRQVTVGVGHAAASSSTVPGRTTATGTTPVL